MGSNPRNGNRVTFYPWTWGTLQVLPFSLQIVEGLVSVSMEIGAAALLGGSDAMAFR